MNKQNIKEVYGLTGLQEGMLFHYLNSGNSAEYILQYEFEMNEKVNIDNLKRAAKYLSEKYEVLKSNIVVLKKTGKSLQVVQKEKEIEFNIVNIEADANMDSKLLEIREADRKRGITLERDSLWRLTLIKKGEDKYTLIWTIHHIIVDGWSNPILFKDFINFYKAQEIMTSESIIDNIKVEKKSLLSYKEYIDWYNKQNKNEALSYWKNILYGYEGSKGISKLYEQEENKVNDRSFTLILDSSIKSELEKFTKENQITINTVLEMAWGIILQKYNNTNDVIFGKVKSGRDISLKGIENSVGLFINTIPIRVKNEVDETIKSLLNKLHNQNIKSGAYDFCSLAEIQHEISKKDSLIETLFVFENYYIDESISSTIQDINIRMKSIKEEASYDISVVVVDSDKLEINFDYSDKYTYKDIELLAKRFKVLISNIILDVNQKIKDINILAEYEKEEILVFSKGKEIDVKKVTLQELLEEQVNKTPNDIAIVFEEEKMTYAEFNEKVNQMAYFLRERGANKNKPIALIMERSIEMLVSMYAVIKSGACYLPINTKLPVNRVNYILENSGTELVITNKENLDVKYEKIIYDDEFNNSLSNYRKENPENVNDIDDNAYIIYTSGTTGTPKGVEVTHSGMSDLKQSIIEDHDVIEGDDILMFADYSFDASVVDINMALLLGGRLHVIKEEHRTDVDYLEKYINENITVVTLPPILANQVKLDGVRVVITAGAEFNKDIFKRNKNIKTYINAYGPTEATVVSTCNKIYDTEIKIVKIPIGKPTVNKETYIINEDGLCGLGIQGELCLAGAGIARGYKGNEKLTEEKFVKNPFGKGKMYRTGDLARWLPDGNIEYLGRIDKQVKIRGFRIEIPEIESQIANIPFVREVATIAKDNKGEKILVSYIVSDKKIDSSKVKEVLRMSLPEYMIPSVIVQIDSIPFNNSGKLDEKALPEFDLFNKEYIEPRTETEKKVAALFSEILGIEKVGLKDDFFELGGHSLKVTKLINRIEAETEVNLSIATIFKYPTVEDISFKIENGDLEDVGKIEKAEKKDYYKMSSSQKRMFVMQEIEENSVTYNMPAAIKIKDEFDINKIQKVYKELINRHESLRTVFKVIDNEPVQEVLDKVEAKVEIIDTKSKNIEEIISEFVRPFNLSQAPLMKMAVAKNDNESYLLIDMHHIISDGLSMNILTKDFIDLYDDKKLESIEYTYADYSEWINNKDLQKHKEYWNNQFEDVPVLELPYDNQRKKLRTQNGKNITIELDEWYGNEIQKLSNETKATPYMILLSQYMMLLNQYSGQEDIVVGTPISGRVAKETESIIGLFVNTLALRGKIDRNKNYIELLEEIKNMTLKGYEYQEYPFEQLVEDVETTRDLSRNPLFDAMFVMQEAEEITNKIDNKSFEILEIDTKTAKVDITLEIIKLKNKYKVILNYNTDLFNEETVLNICSQFKNLLKNTLENSNEKVSKLQLITKEEENLIQNVFNNTARDYNLNRTLIEIFEEQVELSKDSVAIMYGEENLTYKEFNEKVNVLANKLRNLGIKNDVGVAVITRRSFEMMIAIYATIKAGGYYIPIDPSAPKDRIEYMLNDANVSVALVQNKEIEQDIKLDEKTIVINVETFDYNDASKKENLVRINTPKDLAYMIYTSGTTGNPKGVMVPHEGIINRILWMQECYQINSQDVILQKTTYTFDVSVWEILWWSFTGSKVAMLEVEGEKNPETICKAIEKYKVTTMHFVPSMMNSFLSYIEHLPKEVSKLDTLNQVFASGEALALETVRQFKKYLNNSNLCNVYGPTEASVDVSYFDCDCESINKVPIGKPIANIKLYITNNSELCGIGMPGEVCITGVGLARGYKNLEKMTSEKFIENPFGEGRLYRTGDVGRWLPNGNIEYLGRIDDQVKIRGYRIELGEIENTIRRIENIVDVAVVINKNSGEAEIWSYIVSNETIDISELQNEVRSKLPEYMIPTRIMQIDKIPVTSNGKLNRRVLPNIEIVNKVEYIAPITELEIIVEEAFTEILGVENIGLNGHFFQLGGHSLKATQLVNKIEAKIGKRISVRDIFENPTVIGLSNIVENSKEKAGGLIKIPTQDNYETSPAQKRIYALQMLNEDNIAYNMPAIMSIEGNIDEKSLERAVEKLIERHDILRTRFEVVNGELVQIVEATVNAEIVFENANNIDEKKLLGSFIRPFNLTKGSLIRIKFIKGKELQYLLVDIHHIISDGATVNILMKELIDLYKGNKLDNIKFDYKDYSYWINRQNISTQEKFWLENMKDINEVTLPLDTERKSIRSIKGSKYDFNLDKSYIDKINELANKSGTTPYMIMMSIYIILLQKYSNQEDIIIGTPIAGRVLDGVEDIPGMFVNTLAIRSNVDKNISYSEYLQNLKKFVLEAFENQLYPFEKLVEKIDIPRDMSRNPIFDTMFVYQNLDKVEIDIDDILLKGINIESEFTKFDITFVVNEDKENLALEIKYAKELFNDKTIGRLADSYKLLLEEVLKNSESQIKKLEFLTEEHKEEVIKFSKGKELDLEKVTLQELFEDQVERTPDNIAIVCGQEKITYREFNEKVNQMAHFLRDKGAKKNIPVALIMEKSIEMLVAIYGVVKSGSCYLPVNTKLPKERVNYILKNSDTEIVITDKENLEINYNQIIYNKDLDKKLLKYSKENPENINEIDDNAYIIYTSGTTGVPKGVEVAHHGLVDLKHSIIEDFTATDNDNVLLFADYSFDASVVDMNMALLLGGTLHVIKEEYRTNIDYLQSYINKNITVAKIPPILANQLNLDGIRVLITAGSEFNKEIFKRNKNIGLYINAYGPTEATVESTFNQIHNTDIARAKVPIGRPIVNKEVYIVNENGICGVNIQGEIYLTGAGIAKGYRNNKKLTEEKFIKNPFGDGILYKTGDLGKWLSDGNIEYLGRIDDQVKIRGYRIELGEIENILRKIKNITDVAVVVNKDNSELEIWSYIVSSKIIDISEIQNEVRVILPEYMIPTRMMQIDEIPVTSNGKLNKKALPKIEMTNIVDYIVPRTKTEIIVEEAFSETLGINKVGVNGNFFQLGGHSIKAMQLANKIEEKSGKRISIRDIFEKATVKDISELLIDIEEYVSIEKADKKDYYKMSSSQKRMFVMKEIEKESITYNMPTAIKVKGSFDINKIEKVYNELITRHESLRTRFEIIDSEPVQIVLDEVEVKIDRINTSTKEIKEVISEFVKPFNLSEAPLIRVAAVTNSDDNYLLIDMHHIISDGLSMNIFIKDFISLYEGEKLKEIEYSYIDYSEWINNKDLEKHKEYWNNEFEDIPVLELPYDRPREQLRTQNGDSIYIELEEWYGKEIENLSKETNATPYMILLSQYMMLLNQYSGQEDIVVGSPVAGRTIKETEKILGLFVNTLALRGKVDRNKNYKEFLENIKNIALKGYEYQEYPFEQLVEDIDTTRDLSRNPLFDAMFVMQEIDEVRDSIDNKNFETVEIDTKTAKVDITLNIIKDKNNYQIGLNYNTDLFNEETMVNIGKQFKNLLKNTLENPNEKINKLQLITKEEENLIQNVFNNTDKAYNLDRTLVEIFEEQVELSKDSIAIMYDEESLTYKEFNEKVNVLANKLRDIGVKNDVGVAILSRRSFEMMIAIYAIIKAGGYYIPIDPSAPKDRIEYMLNDADVTVALVQNEEIEKDIKLDEKTVVINVEAFDYNDDSKKENLVRINKSKDLAYMIYTSGTTGNPKGVMIPHKGIINRILWGQEHYPISKGSVTLQKTNYTFDVSVGEILWWSFTGATVVMLEVDGEKNPEIICNTIELYKVTTIHFVPSMMNAFLSHVEYSPKEVYKLRTLNQVFTSGEALALETVRQFKKNIKGVKLANVYGPTEASIEVSYFDCDDENINRVPIGKPISNIKLYIANEDKLCGVGMPGEVCITGVGLARGYKNLEKMTSEKFIENPFGGGKLYKTGDLGRWLPDGNIEYLGRIDDQVKIRGYRIELGEIENTLRRIESVTDVAVVINKDNTEAEIWSYIISNEIMEIADLQSKMRETLPEYMIPSRMMQIDEIPVTSNGKLNRGMLPKIEIENRVKYLPPRTEVEIMVEEAFTEVLGIDNIGLNGHFFQLGGHSLKATKLVNRIEAKTGKKISIRDIFESSTVLELSNIIEKSKGKFEGLIKIKNKESYETSPAQKRMYTLQMLDKNSLSYNMPIMINIEGNINEEILEKSFKKLIERHNILRTRFEIENGELVQIVKESIDNSIIFKSVKNINEKEVLNKFIKPFNLNEDSLIRVSYIKDEESKYLLVDMHHIISDGTTLNILVKELIELYEGNELNPIKYDYKDYSYWLNNKDLSSQEKFWIDNMEDINEVLLPLDNERKSIRSFRGENIKLNLDKEYTNKINKLAKNTGATPYMIMMSIYIILLQKYSKQEDIVIGTPTSGRELDEVENMPGMFVNTLAIRSKVDRSLKYDKYLEGLKDFVVKAFENQSYPFEKLVEKLDISRETSRNPIFETMFVYQNLDKVEIGLENITLKNVDLDFGIAKFDITLIISEDSENINLEINYAKDLFNKETINRLANSYKILLDEVLDNPKSQIKDLEYIDAKEKSIILNEFSKGNYEDLKGMIIPELLEEKVKENPDKIAIIMGDVKLTYNEFNKKVNKVARYIRNRGLNIGEVVAIDIKRSIERIIYLYAVIKAGGCYVPISKSWPDQRKEYVLKDSNAKLIITDKDTFTYENLETIVLDDKLNNVIKDINSENLDYINKINDLAYIIYTSGTTGNPKGVMLEHSGLEALRNSLIKDYKIEKDDHVLQFADFSFDASVFEMTAGLMTGATLHMVEEEQIMDVEYMQEYINKNITATVLSPIFASQLKVENLKILMTAGSVFNAKVLDNKGIETFINAYGPTEVTIAATKYILQSNEKGNIPIGKPMINKDVYILNEDEVCAIGAIGEICIGGSGIARGYLNKEELTKKHFIKNPFGEGVLYRTGDLGKWQDDGNIIYLGRIDTQVKIRGFRIELSEIENVFRMIEDIEDAAVITRKYDSVDEICAYFVANEVIDIESIRKILFKNLPEYMIPKYILQIDEIPVWESSGKLNKGKLPTISNSKNVKCVEASTQKEKDVIQVFEDVLKVSDIGIEDKFFDLGGESIKAIRIVTRLREKGYKIEVKNILELNQIKLIAEMLEVNDNRTKYNQEVITGEMKLTPIQKYFFENPVYDISHYNQSAVLESDIKLDEKSIKESLNAIVKHHDVLRATYIDGKQIINDYIEDKNYELNTFDFEYIEEFEELQKIIHEENTKIQTSYVLEEGPMLKVSLFKTKYKDYITLIVHHLAVDGVSWHILMEDFKIGYEKAINNQEIIFSEKTASVDEWVDGLYDYATLDKTKSEIIHWKNTVNKIKDININYDGDGYNNNLINGYSLELTEENTKKLIYGSHKKYNVEINHVLMGALSVALRDTFKINDVPFMIENHGRQKLNKDISIDRTVGWFTSVSPIVISADSNLEDTIKIAKDESDKVINKGIAFTIFRDLLNNDDLKCKVPFVFNNLGSFNNSSDDEIIKISSNISPGLRSAKENILDHDIVFDFIDIKGKLTISIIYNSGFLSEETIINLANLIMKNIEKIINKY